MGDKYSVGEISGANSTEIPLKFLLQHHNVVVMTAQILVNALKSDVRGERVDLKDISLLLFDECHHAHKEHPYNSIMENYLALKAQAGHQHSLPQVRLETPFNQCFQRSLFNHRLHLKPKRQGRLLVIELFHVILINKLS